MNVATLHARVVLAAMSLAALLVLVSTLASPVAAQGGATAQGGEKASASSCSTGADEVATFTTKDDSFGPFRITGESFDVLYSAQADRNSGSFGVAVTEDGQTVTETATIRQLPANDVLEVEDEGPGTFGLNVDASKGIDFAITVCEAGGNGGGSANGGDDDDGNKNNAKDGLENLSCAELLVLFRSDSSSGQQYGDAVALADPEVRDESSCAWRKRSSRARRRTGSCPRRAGCR